MNRLSLLVSAVLLAFPMMASAQIGEAEVRAEVVGVDTDSRQLTVQVLESGNSEVVAAGELHTFAVGDDVPIEYEFESVFRALRGYGLGDLDPGTRLVIEFDDTAGMRRATRIKGDPANEEMRDHAEKYGYASGA